jgi:hypothetical protein
MNAHPHPTHASFSQITQGDPRMSTPRHRGHAAGDRGQVIVIMALALVAIVGGVALILEGGNAFAQQRVTQNAADAAANAGAVVLAERLGGAAFGDADVAAAVTAIAGDNDLPAPSAWYTSIDGELVDASGATVGSTAAAKAVGSGDPIPPGAAGVRAAGTRQFGTFFARVLGITQLQASADATAVTGILSGVCPADAGCGLLPVTFPVLISTCADPHTTTSLGTGPYTLVPIDGRTDTNMSIVPLCTTDPGSVGWLDLGPGNLAQEIVSPTNNAFDVPTWLQTQTGNVNAVEDEINDNYAGKIILIPMFDGTCRVQPSGVALSDCPAGEEGVGTNTWYHIPKFTGFFLEGAYLQGSNRAECNQAPGSPFVGGNGSVSCLKGWFVRFIYQGPVVSGSLGGEDPDAIGVQLIR